MTTQTSTRKSRASRAADKAGQDQAQQQPQPEPGLSDPPDSSGGPSSDTRHKEDQDQQPEPESAAPTATLDLGRYPFYMHKPKVTGPDGVVHECPHRDGHTKVDGGASSAMACARKVARENGLEVGEPE